MPQLQVQNPTIVCNGKRVELIHTTFPRPTACPCCNGIVARPADQVAYRCTNADCPDQVKERLLHACSKGALDWDGMGEATVQLLIGVGVRKLSDLFQTQGFISDHPALDSSRLNQVLGQSSASKFIKERERVKSAPLWRKLHALGIVGVGTTTCKDLAANFSSLEAMFVDAAAIDKLHSLLGPVAYRSFTEGMTESVQEIERLAEFGFKFEQDAKAMGPLSGKSFVITGAMLSGTRDKVATKIEAAGGTVKSSVGKKVNYLVVGEGGGKNKADAAAKLGTVCISEAQLYEMLAEPMPDVAAMAEPEY